ncbi:hypothetical protein DKX38_000894 [Salix brachista]|uniref:SKP1 component POZ domain-containing protein n=1 Tax=Salix brachista TaxID=2182728 RepID=A0A5N5P1P6_9ROSI|nr:hypothetical protein DKX38_000894 [Salix brachista]
MAYTEIEETERQDKESWSAVPTSLEDDPLMETLCCEDDNHIMMETCFMALDKELCSEDPELCSSEGSTIFEDDMMEIFFMALDKDLCSEDQELCSEGPTILEDDMTEKICSEDDKVEKFFMAEDQELCSEHMMEILCSRDDDQVSYCEEPRKIILKSFDEETFFFDEAVAVESQTVRHTVEDDCVEDEIQQLNVTSVAKKDESLKHTVEDEIPQLNVTSVDKRDESLKIWDAEPVKADRLTLFRGIICTSHVPFGIKNLLDLTSIQASLEWDDNQDEALVNNSSEPGHEEDNGFFENPENHDDFHDATDSHDESHQGDLEPNHDDNHQEELEHQAAIKRRFTIVAQVTSNALALVNHFASRHLAKNS